MFRQRLRVSTSALALVGRGLVLLFALALVWYGLMLLLLALKVSPGTVDAISGYRTAFDWLAGLRPEDVDGPVRAIVAAVGLLLFATCGYLALKELPRPYLTRQDLALSAGERGEVRIGPRAIERIAEAAAGQQPGVVGAAGRYEADDLTVNLTVRRARDLPGTLRGAQRRVTEALETHGLPPTPVTVVLTAYDRQTRREIS